MFFKRFSASFHTHFKRTGFWMGGKCWIFQFSSHPELQITYLYGKQHYINSLQKHFSHKNSHPENSFSIPDGKTHFRLLLWIFFGRAPLPIIVLYSLRIVHFRLFGQSSCRSIVLYLMHYAYFRLFGLILFLGNVLSLLRCCFSGQS